MNRSISQYQPDARLPNLLRFVGTLLVTVLGVAQGKGDLGAFIGFLMIVIHFKKCHHLLAEYKTVLSTLLIGGCWEFVIIKLGIISYQGTSPIAGVPLWLLVLWAVFGTTLNGSLHSFRGHIVWGAVLGAFAGPMLGYANSLLGTLSVIDPVKGYLVIGAGWAIMMTVLFRLAKHYSENSAFIDHHVGR